MHIEFTSEKEQCILNLLQTTNNTQCNVVIMNYPLPLKFRDLLENIFLLHTGIAFNNISYLCSSFNI